MMHTPLRFDRQCANRMSLTVSESGQKPKHHAPLLMSALTQ